MEQGIKAYARPETNFEIEALNGEKVTFRIIHWSPTTVFTRIPLVGRYFAVPISMLVGTKPGDEDFAEVIPSALLQLFNTMEEQNLMQFLFTMLQDVYYKNESVVDKFDIVFMGKSDVLIQLVAKIVEINYAPFFKTGFSKLMTSIMPVVGLDKQN